MLHDLLQCVHLRFNFEAERLRYQNSIVSLDQRFQDMIGTCSSVTSTSAREDTEEGEEEEDLEKIRQSEDKILQAHLIR
jgi:hypothetical protein